MSDRVSLVHYNNSRIAAHNSSYPQAGFRVRWTGKKKNKKNCLVDSEVIKSPSLRVAAERYGQVYGPSLTNENADFKQIIIQYENSIGNRRKQRNRI
jgi:hypothetical protein